MTKKISYEFFVSEIYHNPKYTPKQVYWAYLQTKKWDKLRQDRLKIDNFRCRMCDSPATCVHHRNYPDIMGTETVNDLTSLCKHCHNAFHNPPSTNELSKHFSEKACHKNGTTCIICKRFAKVHGRTLYANMAKHLIKLSKLPKNIEGWSQLGDKALGKEEMRNYTRAEYEKLEWWGLTEKKQKGRKRDGVWWRLTNKGHEFINKKIKVPFKIYRLGKQTLKFDNSKMINIIDALKTKFIYEQIMAGVDISVVKTN